jgi:hypothetical protein
VIKFTQCVSLKTGINLGNVIILPFYLTENQSVFIIMTVQLIFMNITHVYSRVSVI